MPINTTTGAKEYDPARPGHTLNTSRLTEEDLTYEDAEPEIFAVVSAAGWQAEIAGEAVPLAVWVVLDDASMFGVVVGEDGLIDPLDSVENNPNFVRYSRGATER
jgi:hypothetical protein